MREVAKIKLYHYLRMKQHLIVLVTVVMMDHSVNWLVICVQI
jgi:hypothetical protein